ncbi:unnamed protein product [Urochloa decumbens]|uniref:F-box domain-containing protein n=1 Tax=Urochloa decumbens TaxID=240449 RepID=A0ABC9D597_9POAL
MLLVAGVRSSTRTNMARAGTPPPMQAQPAAAPPPAGLSEDIHAEILARVPAKSVLRFRSVCRAWRRLTTDPYFLAAHAGLRPAEVVLYRYLDSARRENHPLGYAVDVALDALPVSGDRARRRRLVRYPKYYVTGSREPWRYSMPQHCLLLASCGGVLLFATKGADSYLLCNPITRQWAALPKITDAAAGAAGGVRVSEYAFYFHEPSGEHRLLCGRREPAGADDAPTAWCILSTGAALPRRVDTCTQAADDLRVPPGLRHTDATPVPLHGHLHWPPHRDALNRETLEMVAFDTAAETFHAMAGPRVAASARMKLFAMDGLLVAANFGGEEARHVDLWFLTCYGTADGRWERRHRVATPWGFGWGVASLMATAAACDNRGNVMLGTHHGLSVYNVRTKTVRVVKDVATGTNDVLMSRHVFRESLVQHPGFRHARSYADLPLIHLWR